MTGGVIVLCLGIPSQNTTKTPSRHEKVEIMEVRVGEVEDQPAVNTSRSQLPFFAYMTRDSSRLPGAIPWYLYPHIYVCIDGFLYVPKCVPSRTP